MPKSSRKTIDRQYVIDLINSNPRRLYSDKIVTGTQSNQTDSIEEIAQCVLDNIESFKNGIPVIPRKYSYKQSGHTVDRTSDRRKYELKPTPDRKKTPKKDQFVEEKLIARLLKGTKSRAFGTIFDYEIPLAAGGKDPNLNDKVGNIDLVSFDAPENTLYLIELKRPQNNESLLRAALEIYTYSKQLHIDNFRRDFADELAHGNPNKDFKVVPAILIPRDGAQHDQYTGKQYCPNTHKLIKKLGIKVYTIEVSFKIRTIQDSECKIYK